MKFSFVVWSSLYFLNILMLNPYWITLYFSKMFCTITWIQFEEDNKPTCFPTCKTRRPLLSEMRKGLSNRCRVANYVCQDCQTSNAATLHKGKLCSTCMWSKSWPTLTSQLSGKQLKGCVCKFLPSPTDFWMQLGKAERFSNASVNYHSKWIVIQISADTLVIRIDESQPYDKILTCNKI